MPTLNTPPAKSPFEKSRTVEQRYARTLSKIARHVGDLVTGFPDPVEDADAEADILEALAQYSRMLRPWSQSVAARIVLEADKQDVAAWRQHARQMGKALRAEIYHAPTGQIVRESIARQVGLITSLPTEAGERVHKIALKARLSGTRANEAAKEIQATGSVTRSRAVLIARTEIARTGAELTEARSVSVGGLTYYWRTLRDADVRHDHRILEGKIFAFANPPVADQRTGARANPGCIYRCRCYASPILPD